jgi:hypothetical protein
MFLSLTPFLDFLAVRKIPLKKLSYVTENQQQQEEDKRSEDPRVISYLDKIRAVLKTDRAIHGLVIVTASHSVRCQLTPSISAIGDEGLRIVCPSLFQT